MFLETEKSKNMVLTFDSALPAALSFGRRTEDKRKKQRDRKKTRSKRAQNGLYSKLILVGTSPLPQ